MTLLEQALSVADATGDIEPTVKAGSGLARGELQLRDPAAALAATAHRGSCRPYPAEEPSLWLLNGVALLGLNGADEAVRAFRDALTAADTLLALADTNVAALQGWPPTPTARHGYHVNGCNRWRIAQIVCLWFWRTR